MKRVNLEKYQCPATHEPLRLVEGSRCEGDEIVDGVLESAGGAKRYEVKNGIPDFLDRATLVGPAAEAHEYYSKTSQVYDEYLPVAFELFNADEHEVRDLLTDLLQLEPGQKVLDLTAGTGKDSLMIAEKLKRGEIWLSDITRGMLDVAKDRLRQVDLVQELAVADACALPYRNGAFDAAFSFTGLNSFRDVPAGISEMARVVRKGGRVVFCEKAVPPWLRDSEYGRILIEANPMFIEEIPLRHLPKNARKVEVRWIMAEAFYVISYEVGEGEPKGNFDLELPGARGGTFATRYFGKLEGVTPEVKQLAMKARAKSGKSLHKWLDEVVRAAALEELGE